MSGLDAQYQNFGIGGENVRDCLGSPELYRKGNFLGSGLARHDLTHWVVTQPVGHADRAHSVNDTSVVCTAGATNLAVRRDIACSRTNGNLGACHRRPNTTWLLRQRNLCLDRDPVSGKKNLIKIKNLIFLLRVLNVEAR